MCTGAEPVVAAEAAGTAGAAKGAAEVAGSSLIGGTEVVAGAALTPGGASIAALNTLGPSGIATYGAMEGLAGVAAGATGASSVFNSLKSAASILSPVSSLVSAASGTTTRIGKNSITNGPAVAPAVTMPTFGNADTLNAMRSNIQEQIVRRGRSATILTSPTGSGDKLGN